MKTILRESFKNDTAQYLQVLSGLKEELSSYENQLESLVNNSNYAELGLLSHKIRNISGVLGFLPLKILATYWEDCCKQGKIGNHVELKINIQQAIQEISLELDRNK